MSCPADEELAAWSTGALAAGDRSAVEDHAASCGTCRAVLLALAGVMPQATATTGLGAEGAMIGRYRVTGSLGEGAMGVVLRGHDPMLDREVAIKMSRALTATDDEQSRMLREAQTLARLDHPNVVRVFDAGVVGDEIFVAMEYIAGTTLARWLAATPPRPVAERRRVLADAAAGLGAVHAAGLVHRDVKPDNILVRADGAGVLVDFGLARTEVVTGPAGSGLAGTPQYLAPELRAGGAASARSDQYAWWTVVDEVLGADDPRLAAAIARGRSADPAARMPTMAAAAAILAPPRHRRWWLLGPAAIAVIAVAIVWPRASDPCAASTTASWTRARPAAVVKLAAAGADSARVAAAIDARANRTAALDRETCRAGDDTHARRQRLCVDDSWRETERLFAGLVDADPQLVRAAVDDLVMVIPVERCASGTLPAVPAPPPAVRMPEARAIEKALRELERRELDPRMQLRGLHALEPQVRALGDPDTDAHWHAAIAQADARVGDFAGSQTELEAAIASAEAAGDDDVRARALVNVVRLAGNQPAADPHAIEARAEAAAARLGNPAVTAELHISEGTLRFAHGDVPAALASLQSARRELEAIAIDAHAQLVGLDQNLGALQQVAGDFAAAQATFDAGFALARRRFGDASVETTEIRGARATNTLYRGDAKTARPELAAVADVLARSLGPVNPQVAQARSYVCECDLELHATTDSCRVALATAEHAFGADSPQLAWQLTLVAKQALHAGDPAAAIPLLERTLALTEHGTVGPADRPVAQAYLAIALHRSHREPARVAALAGAARRALAGESSQRATIDELAAELP